MEIPAEALSADALAGLIEEFVTRDGTDLDSADAKVRQVREQLRRGELVIVFDEVSESCNIMSADAARRPAAEPDATEAPPQRRNPTPDEPGLDQTRYASDDVGQDEWPPGGRGEE